MKKNLFQDYLLISFVCLISFGVLATKLEAQWQSLPPYNVLWPLWSPALSPPDPVTGVPTPLVTKLDKNTLLPVQPALVWNPDLPYYYLIYNYINPYGGPPIVKYWDPTEYSAFTPYGYIWQTWPPSYLLQSIEPYPGIFITVPDPIALPLGYESLPYLASLVTWYVPFANNAWQNYYGINPYLLTATDLLP